MNRFSALSNRVEYYEDYFHDIIFPYPKMRDALASVTGRSNAFTEGAYEIIRETIDVNGSGAILVDDRVGARSQFPHGRA